MSVGDINSDERGSGARYNSDKAKVEYIPARVIYAAYAHMFGDRAKLHALRALYVIADFEEGKTDNVASWFSEVNPDIWKMTAEQFHFGAKKYAAWNWIKGMQWSIPMACIKRHAIAILQGELIDPESDVDHRGAIGCNMSMLQHYSVYYTEGDDRPPAKFFEEASNEIG